MMTLLKMSFHSPLKKFFYTSNLLSNYFILLSQNKSSCLFFPSNTRQSIYPKRTVASFLINENANLHCYDKFEDVSFFISRFPCLNGRTNIY